MTDAEWIEWNDREDTRMSDAITRLTDAIAIAETTLLLSDDALFAEACRTELGIDV